MTCPRDLHTRPVSLSSVAVVGPARAPDSLVEEFCRDSDVGHCEGGASVGSWWVSAAWGAYLLMRVVSRARPSPRAA